MGQNIRVTSGPAIERPGDLASILSEPQSAGDVLFIDEIHRLSRSVEEVLYPAMEDFAIDIMIGKGPTARSIRVDRAEIHARGRDNPRRSALRPAARPLRHALPAGNVQAGGAGADRPPKRVDSGDRARRTRASWKSRAEAAVRRESQTGCSSASATTRRCAAAASSAYDVAREAIDHAGRGRAGAGQASIAPSLAR